MKLRKAALLLFLLTVLSPIILYIYTLGNYLSSSAVSSGNDFVAEEASTFTFGGEIGPLNILPQESMDILKEPLGIVYSENSSQSLANFSDAAASDNAHKTRQLTEDSMVQQTTVSSSLSTAGGETHTADENPIRQATNKELKANHGGEELNKSESTWEGDVKNVQAETNREMSTISSQRLDNASTKMICTLTVLRPRFQLAWCLQHIFGLLLTLTSGC